jgi:Reverse transcriptase (RNA-dependent DNA polymerase)
VRVEGTKADEIVAYNDIINYLEEQMSDDSSEQLWKFKDIIAHEGPLSPDSPSYKGSSYNVLVAWEDGSRTYEPLKIFAADCPVVCAIYAKRMGLLDLPGWKQFKTIAKREQKMLRMANQAKLSAFRRDPVYQFGIKVPRSPQEAIRFDNENGNTLWQDAMGLEMDQLQEYCTFKDLGRGAPPPVGYHKIRVHFVFAVKHDGRHKARLVADGHLTATPIDSVYSGVVSLRSLRIVVFLAELNDLELHAADVSNAYLEAVTKERVYIIGGTGFGELEGHTLIIYKALYGLKSSGKRWHERLYDTLRDMGFEPSKADSDVWMRKNEDVYEYIAVYVDDLAIASRNPKKITDTLESKYKLKLKGLGPISYHLGCDFYRDPDGTLCCGPKRYIEKMLDAYERMFGEKPHTYSSPLEKNDHPELDDTKELEASEITKYLSMIGALQWSISLGRFDILTPVMSMASFRAAPREGHLLRLKRIYGYLRKFRHGAIRIRTGIPDYSHLPDEEYDWMYSVYGNVKEQVPYDAPEPLGKEVVTTTYEDANLYHDMLTGRAVTGVLHLLNGTPIDWYSKRQDTVETATYGAEFVAARIATEQIIDLRTTLRYLGVPIKGRAYMFGDNKSVITSSTLPHSRLSKRHNALSYHRVREAIVAGVMRFFHIDGTKNPADILSKHCGYPQLWPHTQPLLFWFGCPHWKKSEEEAVKTVRMEI